MKRAAIVLSGCVSNKQGCFRTTDIITNNYVNINYAYNSYMLNLINCNADVSFDFYIHSWTYTLKNELIKLYNPIKYRFEDNNIYKKDFEKILQLYKIPAKRHLGQLSKALSVKNVIQLMVENNVEYDYVISTRFDIMINKQIILSELDMNNIYIDTDYLIGEMIHIMSYDNAKKFRDLYDYSQNGYILPELHKWIYQYFLNVLNVECKTLHCDSFLVRNLGKNTSIDIIEKYKIDRREIKKYSWK